MKRAVPWILGFVAGLATGVVLGAAPAEAVAIALSDRTVCDHFVYVWNPEGDEAAGQYVEFTANAALSRARTLVPLTRLAGGKVIRLDLRQLAPVESDYKQLRETWERLADAEPYFLVNGVKVEKRVSVPRYRATDGRWYDYKIVTVVERPFGPHCGTDANNLFALTGSRVPIVRADWFLRMALTTLDGGLYYEFRGIGKSTVRGKTDQQVFLESFGASQELVEQLRADQKVAVFRSGVTGKPRAVLMLRGVGTRVGDNQGLVLITQDTADGDVDPRQHPIRNLSNFKFAATEILAEQANGTIAFALFNGQGGLQRSAPDSVARDATIAPPHTNRLQPALSCLVCHSLNKGDDGWKPLQNDVRTLLKSLEVFGEAKEGVPLADTIDRIAGLYLGDFDKPLRRARDDYSDAIVRITGGKRSVQEISQGIGAFVRSYQYDLIDPARACLELGVRTKPEDALATINRLLPPLTPDELAIAPEDPILGAVKAGLKIGRTEWEAVYADAATRATAALLKEKTQQK